jgi:hypothetical protein
VVSEQTAQVVYEESVRTVDTQRELLEGLRARAGTLLASAFVAAAFFSGKALTRPELPALAWIAILLFGLVVLTTLAVLIPWRWTFAHDPHELITIYLEPEPPPTVEELYRNLAAWNGVHNLENGIKLRLIFGAFGVACISLAVEIAIWLVIIVGA